MCSVEALIPHPIDLQWWWGALSGTRDGSPAAGGPQGWQHEETRGSLNHWIVGSGLYFEILHFHGLILSPFPNPVSLRPQILLDPIPFHLQELTDIVVQRENEKDYVQNQFEDYKSQVPRKYDPLIWGPHSICLFIILLLPLYDPPSVLTIYSI